MAEQTTLGLRATAGQRAVSKEDIGVRTLGSPQEYVDKSRGKVTTSEDSTVEEEHDSGNESSPTSNQSSTTSSEKGPQRSAAEKVGDRHYKRRMTFE